MSCTFWNLRRKKAKKAKQEAVKENLTAKTDEKSVKKASGKNGK